MVLGHEDSRYMWVYFLTSTIFISNVLNCFLPDKISIGSVTAIRRVDKELENRGEFGLFAHSTRMKPTNSLSNYGCAERCLAIFNEVSRASHIQANNVFSNQKLLQSLRGYGRMQSNWACPLENGTVTSANASRNDPINMLYKPRPVPRMVPLFPPDFYNRVWQ